MNESVQSLVGDLRCSQCQQGLVPDDRFCSACGATVNACRQCGSVLVAGNRDCPGCGHAVDPAKLTAILSRPGVASGSAEQWDTILERVKGATLDRLQFLNPLGRGGMAAVYLAEDIKLGRMVAVKLILPELMSDVQIVRRFKDEARTVARFRHSNIVTVFSVDEAAGVHFFTMDYIEGDSLEVMIRRTGALPIPTVVAILSQVADALGYAHARDVFHRDVKPANILVDADGRAYVTDFGIAKSNRAAADSALTEVGLVVGTPTYISPEQCLGRPIDGRADQYSLGVVAFEMVTGHPPFDADTSFSIMRCHTDTPPPSVRAARPDCPPAMEVAILRMLSKRPEDRYPAMADALEALRGSLTRSTDVPAMAPRERATPLKGPVAPGASTGASKFASSVNLPSDQPTPQWVEAIAPATGVIAGEKVLPSKASTADSPSEPSLKASTPAPGGRRALLAAAAAVVVLAAGGGAFLLRGRFSSPPGLAQTPRIPSRRRPRSSRPVFL